MNTRRTFLSTLLALLCAPFVRKPKVLADEMYAFDTIRGGPWPEGLGDTEGKFVTVFKYCSKPVHPEYGYVVVHKWDA